MGSAVDREEVVGRQPPLFLGRAVARSAARWAADPVSCSSTAPAFGRFGQPHADLHALEQQVRPPRASVETAEHAGQVAEIVERVSGIGGRRDDLDVADRVLAAPQRPGRQLDPGDVRPRAEIREHRLDDRHRAAERNARDGGSQARQDGRHRLFHGLIQSDDVPNRLGVDGGGEIGG